MIFARALWPGFSFVREQSAQFSVFIFSIVIYAVLGTPTPDALGWVEVLLAGMFGFVFWNPAVQLVYQKPYQVVLIVLAIMVPSLVAGVRGHDASFIARDIVAFLFLMVPVLGAFLFRDQDGRAVDLYVLAFVFLGLSLGLRSVLDIQGIWLADLTYFANSPAVLFAALFLMGAVYKRLAYGSIGRRCVVYVCLLIGLMVIPVMAMGLTLQRASLGFVVLFAAVLALFLLSWRPLIGVLVLGCVAWVGGLYSAEIFDVFELLLAKTRVYGGNMRVAEALEVWREVSDTPLSVLFGNGWGATIESPAVADIRVNFTHSFFTSFLLKTGVVGVVCVAVYVGFIAKHLISVFKMDFVLGTALFAPFVVDLFFYASYKSLDFGLLLLLIIVIDQRLRIESEPQDV